MMSSDVSTTSFVNYDFLCITYNYIYVFALQFYYFSLGCSLKKKNCNISSCKLRCMLGAILQRKVNNGKIHFQCRYQNIILLPMYNTMVTYLSLFSYVLSFVSSIKFHLCFFCTKVKHVS